MDKKELREMRIKDRARLFEQYCKDEITLDEYARRMSEVKIEEE